MKNCMAMLMWGICRTEGKCLLLKTVELHCQAQPSLAGFGDSISIADGIQRLLEAKRGANLRPDYLKSLSCYLARFALGREARAISSVTVAEVESFLQAFPNPNSRATWLNRVSTLFAFALRRNYAVGNPCAQIERIRWHAPFILTPAQARELLKITPTALRPSVILGLFAGIRPDEFPATRPLVTHRGSGRTRRCCRSIRR